MLQIAIVLVGDMTLSDTLSIPAGLQLLGLGEGVDRAASEALEAHLADLAANHVLQQHGLAASAQVIGIAYAVPAPSGHGLDSVD